MRTEKRYVDWICRFILFHKIYSKAHCLIYRLAPHFSG
ncbi:MAG: hypothetical protein ABW158_10425 [Candidatus Thiodiazotropha sp. 6PDIVS]